MDLISCQVKIIRKYVKLCIFGLNIIFFLGNYFSIFQNSRGEHIFIGVI